MSPGFVLIQYIGECVFSQNGFDLQRRKVKQPPKQPEACPQLISSLVKRREHIKDALRQE